MVEKSRTKGQTVKEKDTKPEMKVSDIEDIIAIGKKYECQSLKIGDLEVYYRLPSMNLQQPRPISKDIDEETLFYASSG